MPAATGSRPTPPLGRPDIGGPAVGVLRWIRAAVVALTSSGLALVSHLTAGGAAPRAGTLTVLVALTLLVSLGLSGRRWTIGPLLAMLLGAQALFHVAAEAGAAAHAHTQHMGEAMSLGVQPRLAMTAAHAAAALLTAQLLRRGDDWVWRLTHLLARAWRVARIVVERPAPGMAHGNGLPRYADGPAALDLLEYAVDRRGPPLRTAA